MQDPNSEKHTADSRAGADINLLSVAPAVSLIMVGGDQWQQSLSIV